MLSLNPKNFVFIRNGFTDSQMASYGNNNRLNVSAVSENWFDHEKGYDV